MAYDETLADRIRNSLEGDVALSEKKMFGGVAFLHRGLMFVGVSGSKLMARVGKENYEDSLGREHVREMDFTGKPMQGYVYVDPPGIKSDEQLNFWLHRGANSSSAPFQPGRQSRSRVPCIETEA